MAVVYVRAMAGKSENSKTNRAPASREERLKAALKANIARRKAQAKKRADPERSDREEQ